MQSMPTGAMLSVRAPSADILKELPPELDLAAENSAGLCVVCGPVEAVQRFGDQLNARGVTAKLLETSHAFHSRSMDAAVVEFAKDVQRVRLSPPKLPSFRPQPALGSATPKPSIRNTGRLICGARCVSQAPSKPSTQTKRAILLEVGPRKTLTTLALQRQPGDTRPRPVALACLADRAENDAEWQAC